MPSPESQGAAGMFRSHVSGTASRRAFLLMPFSFAALMAVYSRAREPEVPFREDPGNGAEITLAQFETDGRPAGEARVRKLLKSDDEWRAALPADAFLVTRRKGPERAYTGRYWRTTGEAGVYRCVGCGTALFRWQEKFDSGTGWPSFWAPAAEANVAFARDGSLGMTRVEVMCRRCDAHLGHVFNDGPGPKGLRYCINSAALRFERTAAGS